MTKENERHQVVLWRKLGFGAIPLRQPVKKIRRWDAEKGGWRYIEVRPKQPIDYAVFGLTPVLSEKTHEAIVIPIFLGVEEKTTSSREFSMSRIKRHRYDNMVSFCIQNKLVPIIIVTFTGGTRKLYSYNMLFRNPKERMFRSNAKPFDEMVDDLINDYIKIYPLVAAEFARGVKV